MHSPAMYYGSHRETIFVSLNSDRKNTDSYCDVILKVDEKEFPAHKCILGSISPFFDKMFKTKKEEESDSFATLHSVTSETVQIVLDFLYTTAVNILEENVVELIKASEYFQLWELKDLCCKFLIESVNATNCLSYLAIGQTYNKNDVSDAAIKMAALSFEDIAQQDQFVDIERKDLLAVMESVDQEKINGIVLYESAIVWVKHDYDDRKRNFVHFLKIIQSLPSSSLKQIISDEVLVKDSSECKDHLTNLLLNQTPTNEPAANKLEDVQNLSVFRPDENLISPAASSPSSVHVDSDSKQSACNSGKSSDTQNKSKVLSSVPKKKRVKKKKAKKAVESKILGEPVDTATPNDTQLEKFKRQARSILDRLTSQDFSSIINQLKQLPIDTEVRVREMIDLIYEKALENQNCCDIYARCCQRMLQLRVISPAAGTSSQPSTTVEFRKILLTLCQREFKKHQTKDSSILHIQQQVKNAKTPEEHRILKKKLELAESKEKQRMLGNIRFIGELFKLNILTESVVHSCILSLFKTSDDNSLEALCELLTTVGKELDLLTDNKRMDAYFNQIEMLIGGKNTSLPVRIRLNDVASLRKNKWMIKQPTDHTLATTSLSYIEPMKTAQLLKMEQASSSLLDPLAKEFTPRRKHLSGQK